MKKCIALILLWGSCLVAADGYTKLVNTQNLFHKLIIEGGQLAAEPAPAPEVPYIAGLLSVHGVPKGSPDSECIYYILYGKGAGQGPGKMDQNVDSEKQMALAQMDFSRFSGYNGYQGSGHSIIGIAAQADAPGLGAVAPPPPPPPPPRRQPAVASASSAAIDNSATSPPIGDAGRGFLSGIQNAKLRNLQPSPQLVAVAETAVGNSAPPPPPPGQPPVALGAAVGADATPAPPPLAVSLLGAIQSHATQKKAVKEIDKQEIIDLRNEIPSGAGDNKTHKDILDQLVRMLENPGEKKKNEKNYDKYVSFYKLFSLESLLKKGMPKILTLLMKSDIVAYELQKDYESLRGEIVSSSQQSSGSMLGMLTSQIGKRREYIKNDEDSDEEENSFSDDDDDAPKKVVIDPYLTDAELEDATFLDEKHKRWYKEWRDAKKAPAPAASAAVAANGSGGGAAVASNVLRAPPPGDPSVVVVPLPLPEQRKQGVPLPLPPSPQANNLRAGAAVPPPPPFKPAPPPGKPLAVANGLAAAASDTLAPIAAPPPPRLIIGSALPLDAQIENQIKAIVDAGGKYDIALKKYLEELIDPTVGGDDRISYLNDVSTALGNIKAGDYYNGQLGAMQRSKVGPKIEAVISAIKKILADQRKNGAW